MPDWISGNNLKLLVAGTDRTVKRENGWCSFIINTVSSHEVAVIG
jgi:hypothetical protein